MDQAIDVVKRGRRPTEPFDPAKLRASIVATCLSIKAPEAIAHHAADHVCSVVGLWATDKPEITSADIRRQAGSALTTIHPDAAYLYQRYHNIM
jgi:hypothetical protein